MGRVHQIQEETMETAGMAIQLTVHLLGADFLLMGHPGLTAPLVTLLLKEELVGIPLVQ
jgi:hypothetical protein